MDPLQTDAEAVLQAFHAAIDRGDAAAVGAMVVGGWHSELAFLGEQVPRPGRAAFVGVARVGERGIVYALEDATGLWIAELHRGRDGVTRVHPTGARSLRSRGESARAALDRYVGFVSMGRRVDDDARKWSPVPKRAPLDAIAWAGLARTGTPAADVDAAERTLGTRLPDGYRAYVSRFGEALDTLLLRVYRPARVVDDLAAWRTRIDAFWFWAPASDGFGADDAYRSLRLADTLNGDELLYLPERPDRFYVLPRHQRSVAMLKGSFEQACAWIVESGDIAGPATTRWAQPLSGLVRETWIGEDEDYDEDEDEDTVGRVVAEALGEIDPGGRVLAVEDEDGGWTVLLPAIGGSAFVHAGGMQVSIERDVRAPAAALEKLTSALDELDLQRRDDEEE